MCSSKELACDLFKQFINDAHNFVLKITRDKVIISSYSPNSGWNIVSRLPKRNLDTIFIDTDKKTKLISNIETFYSERFEYAKFGIPHVKVFLFRGPSNTGKTSFITAIASELGKNISLINCKQIVEEKIMEAISSIGDDTFVVIEDIDKLSEYRTGTDHYNFINSLDGLYRKDRLIVFITSTQLIELDQNCVRIDHVVDFNVPEKQHIHQLFDYFYPTQIDRFESFYKSISNKNLSIGFLQKFFFKHRMCDNILSKISELMNSIGSYSKNNDHLYL